MGQEREVQWRLSVLPSADERICPLTIDDSQVCKSIKMSKEGRACLGIGWLPRALALAYDAGVFQK